MWKSKSSIPLREAMLDVRGGIAPVPRTEAEPAAASRVAIAVGNTLKIINIPVNSIPSSWWSLQGRIGVACETGME